MSLKLVENLVVISDEGLCEDFLRREIYIIQFLEQCNSKCKICHKNVDNGEKVKWQGKSMDLSFKLSFNKMLQERK